MTQCEPTGNIRDLFKPSLKKTTFLLSFIWFTQAFAYYGFLLVVTQIFQILGEEKNNEIPTGNATEGCYTLTEGEYLNVFYTSLSEFPGIIAVVFVIDMLGRKKTIAFTLWLTGALIVLLLLLLNTSNLFLFLLKESTHTTNFFSDSAQVFLTIALFIIRGLLAGSWQAVSSPLFPKSCFSQKSFLFLSHDLFIFLSLDIRLHPRSISNHNPQLCTWCFLLSFPNRRHGNSTRRDYFTDGIMGPGFAHLRLL